MSSFIRCSNLPEQDSSILNQLDTLLLLARETRDLDASSHSVHHSEENHGGMFDPDFNEDDFKGENKTVNQVLNELMTRIFPELSGLQPEVLSRIRERIDQSINQTGQANITEIFDLLKRERSLVCVACSCICMRVV